MQAVTTCFQPSSAKRTNLTMHLYSIVLCIILAISTSTRGLSRRSTLIRGGSTREVGEDDAFHRLATAIKPRIDGTSTKSLQRTLKSLSSAQKALKGLDGAAHEAYQRTHSSTDQELTTVAGRARRSAARTASTADAFLSAELCELIELDKGTENAREKKGALEHREVLLKSTVRLTKYSNVSVLVLWEPSYSGGVGIDHGGIKDLAGAISKKNRGRLLIVLKDSVNDDLTGTINILDSEPWEVELKSGLIANEVASVHLQLYRCAGRVLEEIRPILLGDRLVNYTEAAFHFCGQSLGGGIASLAAVILDGSLPMPQEKKRKRKQVLNNLAYNNTNSTIDGLGQGRSSASVLGIPPCLSANVKAAFVKSIIYGDDVICRTTQVSLKRLFQRVRRMLKGGLVGRHVGWMADAASLTVSN